MTLILPPELSEAADPSRPQRRVAVTPSGRQVWIEITSEDRLRVINQLPSRWPDVVKARERGETMEQIHRWARLSREDLAENLGAVYGIIESALHDLAASRARLMI